jgi:hypothetical protein
MGYGGSAFQWHPELGIGFAYTCTLLFPVLLFQNLVLFNISLRGRKVKAIIVNFSFFNS